MRVGLFGGTFDPPHVGHLLAATDAFEALTLDKLLFIPAGQQPFKSGKVVATGEQRLEMLRRMVGDDRRFAADAVEIERGGLSFTVDTVQALADREPGAQLFLLIGEDLAAQFATWREPERIARLAEVVVIRRPGVPPAEGNIEQAEPHLRRIETRRVDVSSTEIRSRVAARRPVRGFVTDAVAEYIEAAALYR
ncbi:MAG TPA: nicotinate-nucleotide adenylyltransferase [Gemmatimonadaceae bacterium]|nr:nicotinate-nucleotide adenylyltransferase [Gemmatimonadaceae bacterium]